MTIIQAGRSRNRVQFLLGEKNFLLSSSPVFRLALRTTWLIQWVMRMLFLGDKVTWHAADHTCPYRTKAMYTRNSPPFTTS